MLDALAWWASVGVSDPSRAQVGFVAGIKPQGGHFGNTVGPLKTAGLIDYQTQGTIALTEQGIPLADWPEAPPTIDTLISNLASFVGVVRAGIAASTR